MLVYASMHQAAWRSRGCSSPDAFVTVGLTVCAWAQVFIGSALVPVKTEIPMPNVGAWYRYSPSRKWMFNLRADWLSASVDKYKGRIWNAAAGVNFSPWDHVGFGLSYQFFQLDGEIREDRWRGAVQTTFTGPFVYMSAYW